MRKTFVMRGKTASGTQEVLQFGKYKQGYAYRLTNFEIFFRSGIGTTNQELSATLTAAKTFEDPSNPNFNNDGLIATAALSMYPPSNLGSQATTVFNHTYIITQNLILAVLDAQAGSPRAVNWQCRFESVKMSGPEEASVNYKQFAISDE